MSKITRSSMLTIICALDKPNTRQILIRELEKKRLANTMVKAESKTLLMLLDVEVAMYKTSKLQIGVNALIRKTELGEKAKMRKTKEHKQILLGIFILEQMTKAGIDPMSFTYRGADFGTWLTRPADRALFVAPVAADGLQAAV